jgi:DNA-directed RNA polymerase alpha subunit
LVEKINKREDLKKLRNCGEKTVDEIMEQLFCYQYSQLKEDKKKRYIRRIMELNKDN